MTVPIIQHASSYRDPSGFVFTKDEKLYRQVNTVFKDEFDYFIKSGCCFKLQEKGVLIQHEIIHQNLTGSPDWYLTVKPAYIDFISYPCEWPFDMLKDAALLTLQLAKEALSFNMILKDATPYNIQWHLGKLIFIDTLSFERYDEEKPWIAYRQFCEMFLSPLLIMHYSKKSMPELLLAYPDGIPLAITTSLLPWRSKFSFHTYLHIHLHAGISEKKHPSPEKKLTYSKRKLLNLLESLESLISQLRSPDQKTVWEDYYCEAADRGVYLANKKNIIQKWIDELPGINSCADLGANDGVFSALLAKKNIRVIATDADAYVVNRLYKAIKKTGGENIQPLVSDLSNPTPATGVNNSERASFISRIKVDLVLALALVHHLAIGKNIPFDMIASFFSALGTHLIIEFVPEQDEKVQLMLAKRKNIFNQYEPAHFEKSFAHFIL